LLRVSPLFIFLFVAAAVLAAFGIHRYMQQAQQSSGSGSFSSLTPPASNGEAIEDIPGEWTQRRNGSEEVVCKSWTPDGICQSEAAPDAE
jgi:hypothetical protein